MPFAAVEPMPGGSYAAPAVLTKAAVNCALDSFPPGDPKALVVHTPLR